MNTGGIFLVKFAAYKPTVVEGNTRRNSEIIFPNKPRIQGAPVADFEGNIGAGEVAHG